MECVVSTNMISFVFCHINPRLLQLCAAHETKERQFREQGKRAGKDDYLKELESPDVPTYINLLEQFVSMHLVIHLCRLVFNSTSIYILCRHVPEGAEKSRTSQRIRTKIRLGQGSGNQIGRKED